MYFEPYVSVAEKREKADRKIQKMMKKDKTLSPVILEGRTIASQWWGKAWNQNLESYADYANRISRGRSYVRNHAVVDLKISEGVVKAQVLGSAASPYKVEIQIKALSEMQWKQVVDLCNHRIATLDQLAGGTFPKELEVLFKERKFGLFPSPKEISFDCSCPDYASMCKHVAAVLYGIGARLDQEPLLFFELRGVDMNDLIKKSVESRLETLLQSAGKKSGRTVPEDKLHDLFGI